MISYKNAYGFLLSISLILCGLYFYDLGLLSANSNFNLAPSAPWQLPIINWLQLTVVSKQVLLVLLFLSAAVSSFFFLLEHGWAKAALLISFAIKILIYFSDYRLMGNYHLIQNWVILIFLISKNWLDTLRILFVGVYFFSGLLRLNTEWLSGHALTGPPLNIPIEVKTALLSIVILLECFGIWILLFASKKLNWILFCFLIIFHLVSIYFVQLYFPSQMIVLLSFIPLALLFEKNWCHIRFIKLSNVEIFILILFLSFQLIPYASPGDTALTGEGKLTSLTMLDSSPECRAILHERTSNNKTIEVDLGQNSLSPRARCDVAAFISDLKKRCKNNSNENRQFGLLSRRKTSPQWTPILWMNNVCSQIESYSFLGRNKMMINANDPFYVFSQKANNLQSSENSKIPPTNFRKNMQNTGEIAVATSAEFPKQSARLIYDEINIGIHRAAKSTPATDETGYYVAGDNGELIAFNLDHTVRWTIASDADRGIHSSPLVIKDSVYFGTYSGRFYRVNKATGEIIWWVQLGDAIGATPRADNDSIYVNVELTNPSDGYIVKLNQINGSVSWVSKKLTEQSHSTPALSLDFKILVVGDNAGKLQALNTSNGNIIWTKRLGEPIKTAPMIYENQVYVTSLNPFLHSFDLKSGKHLNSVFLGSGAMSSPLLLRKEAIIFVSMSDGNFHWIDANSFKILKTLSEGETSTKASGISFTAKQQSFILVGCKTQSLCLLNASGKLLAREPVGGPLSNEPAYLNGFLVLSPESPGKPLIMPFPKIN